MKAEERHQLQQNDLASWLQYGLPMWLKNNGSYVLLVLALCFLGYQLYNMYERKQENARIVAFDELRAAPSSENPIGKLQGLIDTTEIPALKAQACLLIAQQYQDALLFPEKSKLTLPRAELLDRAAAAYARAADIYGDDILGSGKALLGKAGVEEDRQKWDDAAKIYETIADPKGRFAGSPYATLAAERLKSLPERRNTPRLASMMPPPTTAPSPFQTIPGGSGALPGTFGPSILGPEASPGGFTMPTTPVLPTTQPK